MVLSAFISIMMMKVFISQRVHLEPRPVPRQLRKVHIPYNLQTMSVIIALTFLFLEEGSVINQPTFLIKQELQLLVTGLV